MSSRLFRPEPVRRRNSGGLVAGIVASYQRSDCPSLVSRKAGQATTLASEIRVAGLVDVGLE